ncbi:MAG: diaminopimelate decarboxylase [bacterium]|jgi:diaminopimelate decarboxylase|nr:diaminopimelate decarboxylase [bacterium]
MQEYPTNSRYFTYRDGSLFVENADLRQIAKEYATPVYVYSTQAILDVYQGYAKGLEGISHLIAFAVKANGNLAILNLLAKQGAGADLTSGGEMYLAQQGGIPANRMVFSGVGKTEAEIRRALEAGILMFNVESEPELDAIARIAQSMGKVAPIAIRVNPEIDARTHKKITTGLRENKFGILWEQALPLYEKASKMDAVQIVGIASHIGSSLADTTPLLEALDRLLSHYTTLSDMGIRLQYIDIGGGLGINYKGENPESAEDYARKLKHHFQTTGATLILEPGRSIVGNAGLLLSQVTYIKRTPDKTFVVVDAGMNDLARPAIYEAYHAIVPVLAAGETETVEVVGPICESSDVFGRERVLPQCQEGDLLAVCSAGAYGFSMASYYNGRVRPAEVLVQGSQHRLVRKRETVEDLARNQMV